MSATLGTFVLRGDGFKLNAVGKGVVDGCFKGCWVKGENLL